jgi:predicted HAD superfamily Cof-like phosphohydrolase
LKELADVLVVVYGAFVAMGVDGDQAFRIVMRNNFDKLEAHTFRSDGKVEVSAEKKAELKAKVLAELADLLQ